MTNPEAASPMAASGTPMNAADCFTIGILVGAIQGDVTAHFGSLGGIATHASTAVRYGLVEPSWGEWLRLVPTQRGRDLHERHNLGSLPPGRAYLWPPSAIAAALADLNERG